MNRVVKAVGASALCAMSVAALAQKSPAGDREFRVYDVRDVLPVEVEASAPPPQTEEGSALSPFQVLSAPSDGWNVVGSDRVMLRLCEAMGLSPQPLANGLVGVSAEAGEHALIERALESLRAMSGPPIDLEIVWWSEESASPPAPGSDAKPPASARRWRQAVRERTPAAVTDESHVPYFADWTPIVSDNAVAYDPVVDTIVTGLTANCVVTTSGEERVTVRITGMVRTGTIIEAPIEFSGDGPTRITLGLPRTTERVVNSTLMVPLDAPKVVAVVMSADQSVTVIAATVRRMAEK